MNVACSGSYEKEQNKNPRIDKEHLYQNIYFSYYNSHSALICFLAGFLKALCSLYENFYFANMFKFKNKFCFRQMARSVVFPAGARRG